MEMGITGGLETGFGISSIQELNDLRKALEAGYQVSGQTGGGALRVQSLESSLKVVTFTQRHFKFWQEVPKLPAYSTVEEYNRLNNYGPRVGGFIPEGVLPVQDDSTYTRMTSLVKYLGTTRQVSHPLTLVRPAHGDVIALENQNGILWILERLENAFFRGDSTLVFSGEGPEFDGMSRLIDATNVIDLEGNPITEEVIEEGANTVLENFGTPTHMFLSPRAMADFSKLVFGKERFIPQQASVSADGKVGYFIQSVTTQAGPIGLRPDVFIRKTPTEPGSADNTSVPTAPSALAAGALAGTDGDFEKSGAGTYTYSVTAANRFGQSAATIITAPAVFTAADFLKHVPLTITNAVSVSIVPEFFIIYRSEADGTVRYEITRVKASSQANSGVTLFNDLNSVMPNTSEAYLGEMSTQVLAYKQLAPLMKMDLAIVAPAYRWMILMYGVLILYAPKKWVKYKNIGESSAIATV